MSTKKKSLGIYNYSHDLISTHYQQKIKKRLKDTLLCVFDEPAGHRRAALLHPAKRLLASFHRMIFNGL